MRPLASASASAAALALALAACGKTSEPDAPPFTFAAVAGMSCADGSPTGIGISRGSAEVLLFLNGGGACWDSCHCDPTTQGPFGAAQLALGQTQLLPGSILDRSVAGNPFAGFTMVFVPYCTGDVHAGDAVQTYPAVGVCPSVGTWQHRGHRNVEAVLDWIQANLPRPARIVVAGSSAGAFGSLLAYDAVRRRWPDGAVVSAALLDDSGPTFDPPALDTALTYAWWDAWNLGSTVTPLCAGCKDHLSEIWTTLSGKYPSDLFALTSTTQDETMRGFFGEMTSLDFQNALVTLTGTTLEPLGNVKTFLTAGTDHALLRFPASYTAAGTPLLAWLDPIAVGTGAFVSAGP
jgi:hypothetical protein